MDFAIDRQQFLQGYLPIDHPHELGRDAEPADRRRNRSDVDQSRFVTKDNAADVIALAAKGLR